MDFGSWVPTIENGSANFTPANLLRDLLNDSRTLWDNSPFNDVTRLEDQHLLIQEKAYRDFTTTIQVFILIGSLVGNAMMLWCACSTSIFKSVTSRFIKNLACSGICASLACVPFDVALGASPDCCRWLRMLLLCKVIKFLHKLFCSATVLSFAAIALDRYYSVLYPLERKISDGRSRDLVVYIWVHATVASLPVFVVMDVTDVYVTASCWDGPARSPGHTAYVLAYNATTVVLPLALVFVSMALIRRALSASQKKKVVMAALRTPQNSMSIPYVSQREAELHATLLAVVLAFSACSAPYGALVVYRSVLARSERELPAWLYLTAAWLPKVSLLTNPVLFLAVNSSARRGLLELLAGLHRRCSRRNMVSSGGLGGLGGAAGGPGAAASGLEIAGRSGSQLLEMFNIGQQQIFRPSEEEEDEVEGEMEKELPSLGPCFPAAEDIRCGPRLGILRGDPVPRMDSQHATVEGKCRPPMAVRASPMRSCACSSSSQVAPATPTEDAALFGLGPFELPPHWLPETRSSKKRLLPPLGNTPEDLIQTKQPRPRPERRISRNNKVSTIPAVDP